MLSKPIDIYSFTQNLTPNPSPFEGSALRTPDFSGEYLRRYSTAEEPLEEQKSSQRENAIPESPYSNMKYFVEHGKLASKDVNFNGRRVCCYPGCCKRYRCLILTITFTFTGFALSVFGIFGNLADRASNIDLSSGWTICLISGIGLSLCCGCLCICIPCKRTTR